jgi:sugar (pentulose or hexulose) kinase
LTRQLGVGDAFIHTTHNPVGGAALDWIRQLSFSEQKDDREFYERTIPEALQHSTRVTLDPPYLAGHRLEIEAARAAFRDLTLATHRLDLLAAVLQAMQRHHREAVGALGKGMRFRRVFLTGGGADLIQQLIPDYGGAAVEILDEGSLRGVACLFQ